VKGPLVAFLGVRRPYKGFDVLLAALPELGRRLPSATVVFAGPGDPIAGEHAVRVIDRGNVSDDERADLLEAADVLCLPSASEIFPVTLLEAWSAETAVLTSNIPPLAELMRRAGGGIAVPRQPGAIATGLVTILGDHRRELAAAGHRYWRAHATVEAVVERHEDLYRSLIADRRNCPAGELDRAH
jgi:phosphatidylinositol alpha-mannosyltransferase